MQTLADPKQSALLAHIVAQTQNNIDFLVSQNYLRASDAASLLSKLASLNASTSNSNAKNNQFECTSGSSTDVDTDVPDDTSRSQPVLSVAERMRHLNIVAATEPVRAPSPPKAVIPTRRIVPPPSRSPVPRVQQAKALWDYNDNGSDPNDLSFREGDIIDIIAETNNDWWTGRHNGRQGLFPSNYVQKLPSHQGPVPNASPARSPIPVPEPMGVMFGQHQHPSPAPSYAPSYSSYPGAPPPAPAPVPSWQAQPYGYTNEKQHQVYAPPPPQQMQLQAPLPPQSVSAPEPEKKSKFGGLGNTMANSAAGGVGFGAGAAIGSGIINSIF